MEETPRRRWLTGIGAGGGLMLVVFAIAVPFGGIGLWATIAGVILALGIALDR